MFSDFLFYFKEGWHHLVSFDGKDHILFLLVLIAPFRLSDWKHLFWLVSAFTVGHSITLALVVTQVIKLDNFDWVEIAIPITIMLSAIFHLYNIFTNKSSSHNKFLQYAIIASFGLIHGLGYANGLSFSLASDQSLAWCLLSFNIGLEVAQIVVLAFILLIIELVSRFLNRSYKWFYIFLCLAGFLLALVLLLQKI